MQRTVYGLPAAGHRAAGLAALLCVCAVAAFTLLGACSQQPSEAGGPARPRAAIIDQLHSTQPNPEFTASAVTQLEACGFAVDLYQGSDINVDFYRSLTEQGYRLIIFRAHSGLLRPIEHGGTEKTAIFTDEPYSRNKYLYEQLERMLPMVSVGEGNPFFFGIDAKFVEEAMPGSFDGAVVIAAGCSCIYLPDMARAFLNKGCSVYMAWDGPVTASYVDDATLHLIAQLSRDAAVADAVRSTMTAKGADPVHKAKLHYVPPENGERTLKQLALTVD